MYTQFVQLQMILRCRQFSQWFAYYDFSLLFIFASLSICMHSNTYGRPISAQVFLTNRLSKQKKYAWNWDWNGSKALQFNIYSIATICSFNVFVCECDINSSVCSYFLLFSLHCSRSQWKRHLCWPSMQFALSYLDITGRHHDACLECFPIELSSHGHCNG